MTEATKEVTREKLVQDFNAVVTETEQLLKDAAAAGGDKAAAWRGDVERKLRSARERLAAVEQAAVEKTKAAARATDEYVHEKPWQAIGITAGVSLLAGVTIGLLLNRHR
jgi:ElaB/YqjD/DUF883 family membrane-anchored ribosome-binding protein